MPDLKKYWQEIRAIERSLPEFVWLMSLDNAARGQVGGRLSETTATVAAKLLHAKSHRLATEEEITTHQERELARQRARLQEKLRLQGVGVVQV
jgi:hypothetical protein